MKRRSKIAAIILSLSLSGVVRAGVDSWLLAAFAVTNVGPYIGAAINTATNMGNLYLSYRNGQKIDAVQQQVQQVGDKVDTVDNNVTKLGKKVDKTNTLMGGLYEETKIGFQDVNSNLAQNAQQLGIVQGSIQDLTYEHRVDMQKLQDQNDDINSRLNVMSDGISGVHEKMDNLSADMKELKNQNHETQTQLTQMNDKLNQYAEFAATAMQQLASIQALLQQMAAAKDEPVKKNK